VNAIDAIDRLNGITESGDTEIDHSQADLVLIQFMVDHDPACKEVAEAWERARDRAGFWYA
jgi:hypothetical protein